MKTKILRRIRKEFPWPTERYKELKISLRYGIIRANWLTFGVPRLIKYKYRFSGCISKMGRFSVYIHKWPLANNTIK